MKLNLTSAALLAAVLGAGQAASAQTAPVPQPIGPDQLDRTQFRASARAQGMGGADLLLFGDVSGAAFNPAAIAFAGPSSETNTLSARTSNVHVGKINSLSSGLKDLGDQFNSSSSSLAGIRDAFRRIYSFASDAGAGQNGSPTSLTADAAPLAGINARNFGVVGYGSLAAKVSLQAFNQAALGTNYTNLGTPSGAETAAYGVLGLTNIAVPFSIKTAVGAVGISPRYEQASYAGAGFMANETSTANGFDSSGAPNGEIAGATYREVQQSKFDLDLGYISNPDPVYHLRGAVAVHNLLSPDLSPAPAHQQQPRRGSGRRRLFVRPEAAGGHRRPRRLSPRFVCRRAAQFRQRQRRQALGAPRLRIPGRPRPVPARRLRPEPLRRRPRPVLRRHPPGPRRQHQPAGAGSVKPHLRRPLTPKPKRTQKRPAFTGAGLFSRHEFPVLEILCRHRERRLMCGLSCFRSRFLEFRRTFFLSLLQKWLHLGSA